MMIYRRCASPKHRARPKSARPSRIALMVACLSGFGVSTAHAQSSSKASAEALFAEGRRLMAEGQAESACPKFADSNRLDASSGTLINLGACYEKTGRTASGWAAYQEAASVAQATGRLDNLQVAQRRAVSLAPSLTRVVVVVTAAVAGIDIQRDGVPVATAEWGLAVPVDPGKHVYEAQAPGYKAWRSTVDVTGKGQEVQVTIPALERVPPSAPTAATANASRPTDPTPSWRPLRTAALLSGGIGLVGAAVGTVFAVRADSIYRESLLQCRTVPDDKNACTPVGVSVRNDARLQGNVATVAFVGAAVATVVGIVLWIVAPPPRVTKTARAGIAPRSAAGVTADLSVEW
jgi:hypothetical protein